MSKDHLFTRADLHNFPIFLAKSSTERYNQGNEMNRSNKKEFQRVQVVH
ncbi:hypothetical protein [Domibacillus mangrovi]|nr:hypothetical protein [Domibacillus mangrovi]